MEKNAQHLKMMGKIGAGGAPAGGAAAAPVSDGMSPDEVGPRGDSAARKEHKRFNRGSAWAKSKALA